MNDDDPKDKDKYHLYRPEEDKGKPLYHINLVTDDDGNVKDAVVRPVEDVTKVWPEGYYVKNNDVKD